MPSLQIRDLPEHLYRLLADRAKRNRRSLAQQATIELERLAHPRGRSRRHETIAILQKALLTAGARSTSLDPVAAVREDRDR